MAHAMICKHLACLLGLLSLLWLCVARDVGAQACKLAAFYDRSIESSALQYSPNTQKICHASYLPDSSQTLVTITCKLWY